METLERVWGGVETLWSVPFLKKKKKEAENIIDVASQLSACENSVVLCAVGALIIIIHFFLYFFKMLIADQMSFTV